MAVEGKRVMRAVSLAAAVEFFNIPLFGLISDRWSRNGVYALGSLFLIAFALPYYALLGTRESVCIVVAVVV